MANEFKPEDSIDILAAFMHIHTYTEGLEEEVERLEKELLNKVVGDVLNPTNDLLEAAGFKMTPGKPVSMTYTVEQRDDEFVINDVVYVRADSIKKQTVWVRGEMMCDENGKPIYSDTDTGAYDGEQKIACIQRWLGDIAEVKEWKPLHEEIEDIKKECGIICEKCGQALPSSEGSEVDS